MPEEALVSQEILCCTELIDTGSLSNGAGATTSSWLDNQGFESRKRPEIFLSLKAQTGSEADLASCSMRTRAGQSGRGVILTIHLHLALRLRMGRASSSSVGATARCRLWTVEQYLSICPYLSPTLSNFSLPTLEDLFPLLLSILSWVFLFVSSLPVLE